MKFKFISPRDKDQSIDQNKKIISENVSGVMSSIVNLNTGRIKNKDSSHKISEGQGTDRDKIGSDQ